MRTKNTIMSLIFWEPFEWEGYQVGCKTMDPLDICKPVSASVAIDIYIVTYQESHFTVSAIPRNYPTGIQDRYREVHPFMFRQVLAQGHRKRPEYFIGLIDKVTRDDINRIGAKMLSSKVSLAAIGDIKKLPSFNDIELGLLDKEVSQSINTFSQLARNPPHRLII